MLRAAAFATIASTVSAKVYFKEQFNDADWEDRWVVSENKPKSERGDWEWTAGDFYADEDDKGLKTSTDARFYQISADIGEAFTLDGSSDLVIQYTVKHEQKLDCGGAYIKLLPEGLDQSDFSGDSPYEIMFGPDICGSTNKKTHAIFHYDRVDDNIELTDEAKCETDRLSHLYTFVIGADATYDIRIDDKSVQSGDLLEGWEFIPPKMIKDPEDKKPSDWVDEKKIPDPEDAKPEDWDEVPEFIPDPDAEQPEDWDEDEDGTFEPPMMTNPEYKGEWEPKMIDNPDYNGPWKQREIQNPDWFEDDQIANRCTNCRYVGFELWQVLSGTVFDDIIITDSLEEAQEFAQETFFAKKSGEKEMYDEVQAAEREKAKKEREEREAERKRQEAEEEEEDEEEDDGEL